MAKRIQPDLQHVQSAKKPKLEEKEEDHLSTRALQLRKETLEKELRLVNEKLEVLVSARPANPSRTPRLRDYRIDWSGITEGQTSTGLSGGDYPITDFTGKLHFRTDVDDEFVELQVGSIRATLVNRNFMNLHGYVLDDVLRETWREWQDLSAILQASESATTSEEKKGAEGNCLLIEV